MKRSPEEVQPQSSWAAMATAMAVIRTVLVSIPPMAAALFAYKHLNAALAPFMDPVIEACKMETEPLQNPVMKFYAFFNCAMIPFFTEVVTRDEGLFIWGNFVALGAAFGGFQAVESSRLGTRFPIFLHALYTFVFMFIGVSIGMPLLWLPAYFAVGMPSSFCDSQKLKISWPRVWAIWVFNIIFFVTGAAPMPAWELYPEWRDIGIKLAIWVPILTPLLWLLIPVSKTSNAAKGQQAVIFMHCCNAGVALACHIALALFLASKPFAALRLALLPLSSREGEVCVYFLMVDLAIFWVAMVYQVLVEDGLVAALLVILATPLLGLGAPLSFYYMYRESKIFGRGQPRPDEGDPRAKAE